MDRPEAIQLLKRYQHRAALLQSSFHFGDNSVDETDIHVADDFSRAIELAIDSLEEDCRSRREAKRYKKKYLSVLLAVKQVYNEVMTMDEQSFTEMDLVALQSFLREHFLEYVIQKQEDLDDTSGS